MAVQGLETILRHSTRITSTQLSQLVRLLTPFVSDCLKYPKAFNRLFYIFNILLTLSSFGPLIRGILKTGLGLIFSSIGILWSESLSSITVLKDLSMFIIDNFESLLGFKVPAKDISESAATASDSADIERAGYFFTFAGLFLLGFVVPLVALCVTNHYYPGVVDSIPYGNTVVNTLYDAWHSFTSYFSSTAIPADAVPAEGSIAEAISRSSSGDSDRTVRGWPDFRNITPLAKRLTRTGTPAAGGSAINYGAGAVVPHPPLNVWE